jgi:hypothetical protein
MCCGSKRLAMRTTVVTPEPMAEERVSTSVVLRSKDTEAVRVRGPVTGRPYDFTSAQPAQSVDPRDAAVLTRSGLFYRV